MDISLVIPGRNAARTVRPCLDAVVPLLHSGALLEIIFVDDGSTDSTPAILAEYPIRYVRVERRGPGGARNEGWKAARGTAVWFIDSDCVAAPDALERLKRRIEELGVAGAGGSYSNLREDSLLACLIQEEIRDRHLAMRGAVDYLGSFNVLYWKWALEQAGGFDETDFNAPQAPGAEDADLSYRLCDLGLTLRFEPTSVVGHHHPTRLGSYFRSQRLHGRWGARLYYRHRTRAGGNSYSTWLDHVQPALALGALIASPGLLVSGLGLLAPSLTLALAGLQLPMAVRILRRTRRWRYVTFIPMSLVRAAWRGIGLTQGAAGLLWNRPQRIPR